MYTLHLTKDEQKLFAKLPAELTKDLSVVAETLTYEDSPQRRKIRLKQLTIVDASLKKFLQTAALASSEKEFGSMISALDLDSISENDIAEILFAIGPDGIAFMISQALSNAQGKDAMELACTLSLVRHEMLEALTTPIV